jgi:fructose-1,6-bisphosphatase II
MCSRFAPITEAAALAAAEWEGRGDALAADQAARDAMAAVLDTVSFRAHVVAGRMGQDMTARMQPGQTVGGAASEAPEVEEGGQEESREPVSWDLAVAPVEGHDALARGLDGALAMIAAAPAGGIMSVPEMYMQKIAVAGVARDAIDMRAPVGDNIRQVASALGRRARDLTVAVLDRPRHDELIEDIKRSGARLRLIDDGDVSASIAAAVPDTGIDICMGIGGSTEGIITAAALRCLGGAMQARFWPVSRYQVQTLNSLGIDDIEVVLKTEDMARHGVLVAVTAVTSGRFLRGVAARSDGTWTETMVMCSRCNKISVVKTIHRQESGQPTPSLWKL